MGFIDAGIGSADWGWCSRSDARAGPGIRKFGPKARPAMNWEWPLRSKLSCVYYDPQEFGGRSPSWPPHQRGWAKFGDTEWVTASRKPSPKSGRSSIVLLHPPAVHMRIWSSKLRTILTIIQQLTHGPVNTLVYVQPEGVVALRDWRVPVLDSAATGSIFARTSLWASLNGYGTVISRAGSCQNNYVACPVWFFVWACTLIETVAPPALLWYPEGLSWRWLT